MSGQSRLPTTVTKPTTWLAIFALRTLVVRLMEPQAGLDNHLGEMPPIVRELAGIGEAEGKLVALFHREAQDTAGSQ